MPQGETRKTVEAPILKPYKLNKNGKWVNPNPPNAYPYMSDPNLPKEMWKNLPEKWQKNLAKYVK